MVEREIGQIENSILADNIVKMSREHNVPIRFKMDDEREYTGIPIDIKVHALTGISYLLRYSEDGHEKYVLLNSMSIASMEFTTKKGFLDNLIE